LNELFDIPADRDTPVTAFEKLAPMRPRFLLESVIGGELVGRYSFLGFGDAAEIRLDAAGLTMDGELLATPQTGPELLDALRDVLARTPTLTDGPFKFSGGLVGFGGYDLARRFERLRGRRGADSADSVDSAETAPGQPIAGFVAPCSVLVFDNLTRRAALLHAGSEAERRAMSRELADILAAPAPTPGPRAAGALAPGARAHGPTRASFGDAAFLAAVERAQEHIAAGDIFQTVLSIRYEAECELAPFDVYRALRRLNPSPYLYYLDVCGTQIVGSSPEALVRLDGRTAHLKPIAGTRPRGATPAEDRALEAELLADPKEAAEHVMLVDLARNDVGRVAAPGTVAVAPYRVVERYSHVMHIVSGVRGELREGADAFDLYAASFPAGTVSGAPKVRAMQLIDELEPVDRGVYSGTVGYFDKRGGMDQALAIRTLMFRDGRVAWQAGAGIVAGSVPERELAEIRAKAAALEAALTLAREEGQ